MQWKEVGRDAGCPSRSQLCDGREGSFLRVDEVFEKMEVRTPESGTAFKCSKGDKTRWG